MANAMQELMDMKIWFLWRKGLNGNRINKIPFAWVAAPQVLMKNTGIHGFPIMKHSIL